MVKLTTNSSDSNIVKFSIKEFLKNKDVVDAYIKLQGELDEAECGYYKKHGLPNTPRSREFILKRLSSVGDTVYMGLQNGTYVSAASTFCGKGEGNVFSIVSVVVAKSMRGKGLGKQLMKYIVNDKSDAILHLNVNSINPAGIALYESVGFKITSHSMYRVPK